MHAAAGLAGGDEVAALADGGLGRVVIVLHPGSLRRAGFRRGGLFLGALLLHLLAALLLFEELLPRDVAARIGLP